MTSSLRHNIRARAFTLIEMLVVIGLIVVLVAIAIPMVSRAHRASIRNAMAADLAVISNALEAYKADFGDYPRRTSDDLNGRPLTGASILCWALIAPGPAAPTNGVTGDGADGPGFRVRGTTGTVKGPYLPTDRFTVGEFQLPSVVPQAATSSKSIDDVVSMLGDRNYRPILYYPANKAADIYSTTVSQGAYVGLTTGAMFNLRDNDPSARPGFLGTMAGSNILSQDVMCFRLGALGPTGGKPDGNVHSPAVPATTGPYLLWAAGPDTFYGTDDDVVNAGNELQLNTSMVPSNFNLHSY